MSSRTVRDALEKVRDPAANAVAELGGYAGQARDEMMSQGRQAAGTLQNAARSARRKAGAVGDELAQGYDAATQYASRRARDAVSLVQQHPAAAIAIAAGLGVLIGGLLLVRRSR